MILKDVEPFEVYDCKTGGCGYEGESFDAYVNGMQKVLEDLDSAPEIDPESLPVVQQLRAEVERLNKGIENLSKNVESAYKQRDAAIEELHGYCPAYKNYTENHCEGACADCKHEYWVYDSHEAQDRWEWRGVEEG